MSTEIGITPATAATATADGQAGSVILAGGTDNTSLDKALASGNKYTPFDIRAIVTSATLDTTTEPGIYNNQANSFSINGCAGPWILEVTDGCYVGTLTRLYVKQRATCYDAGILRWEFERVRNGTTGWSTWRQVMLAPAGETGNHLPASTNFANSFTVQQTFSQNPAIPAASAAITAATDTTHAASKAEVFNTLATTNAAVTALQQEVDGLEGVLVPRGTIQQTTANVTAPLLEAFVLAAKGSAAVAGDAVIDLQNEVWIKNTDGAWVTWGNDTVATATNTSLGIVQGSTLSGDVSVNVNGSMTVNGWSSKANDAYTVHTINDESISGIKTFAALPAIPTAASAIAGLDDTTHPATRAEVYATAQAAAPVGGVDLTSAQTITGIKTFSNSLLLPSSALNLATSTTTTNTKPATQTDVYLTAKRAIWVPTDTVGSAGFNYFVNPGLYSTNYNSSGTGVPVGSAWIVEVVDNAYNGAAGSYLMQRVTQFDLGLTNSIWVRQRMGTDAAFGPWRRIYPQTITDYVTLDTAQTITGVKTFGTNIIVPAASAAITSAIDTTHPATKAEVYATAQAAGNFQPLLSGLTTVGLGTAQSDMVQAYQMGNSSGVAAELRQNKGQLQLNNLQSAGGVVINGGGGTGTITLSCTTVNIPTASAALTSASSPIIPTTRSEVYNTVVGVLTNAINDSATTTTNVWSASKVNTSLAGKVNTDGTKVLSDVNYSTALNTKLTDLPTAATLTAQLAAKATDTAVVHVTGNETVAGLKAFTTLLTIPAASTAPTDATDTTHPATLAQVYNMLLSTLNATY